MKRRHKGKLFREGKLVLKKEDLIQVHQLLQLVTSELWTDPAWSVYVGRKGLLPQEQKSVVWRLPQVVHPLWSTFVDAQHGIAEISVMECSRVFHVITGSDWLRAAGRS